MLLWLLIIILASIGCNTTEPEGTCLRTGMKAMELTRFENLRGHGYVEVKEIVFKEYCMEWVDDVHKSAEG